MVAVIWFIASALGYLRASASPYELNEQQLQELYKLDIKTLQLVERPLGSTKDNWIFRYAGKMGFKHRGVLATLSDGQQFLVHKVRVGFARVQLLIVLRRGEECTTRRM